MFMLDSPNMDKFNKKKRGENDKKIKPQQHLYCTLKTLYSTTTSHLKEITLIFLSYFDQDDIL